MATSPPPRSPPPPPPAYENVEVAMFVARTAANIERYEDVVSAMEDVARVSGEELTTEARTLVDLGYRKVMNVKRIERLRLEWISLMEEEDGTPLTRAWTLHYILRVETEMNKICSDASDIIYTHLLFYATSPHDQLFYHNLLGDLYRYCSELKGQNWIHHANVSLDEYQMAEEIAGIEELPGNNLVRLCLAYGISTCYMILSRPERAFDILTRALDAALSSPAELDERCVELVLCLNTTLDTWFDTMRDGGPVPRGYGSVAEENGENVDGVNTENGGEVPHENVGVNTANGGEVPHENGGINTANGGEVLHENGGINTANGGEVPHENVGVDTANGGEVPHENGGNN